ncbi:MAG: hypothetical protein WD845_06760 [Pirellulales bacterium]
MVDREVLAQQWTDVCARLQQKWSQLSEADFRACEESVERLIDQIQQKTGESREVITQFLSQVADEAAVAAREFRDTLQGKLQAGAGYAADTAKQGYEAAERVVQERPGQSLTVAFGLGVAAGVGLAILLRERPSSRAPAHQSGIAEQFGRQLAEALSRFAPKR